MNEKEGKCFMHAAKGRGMLRWGKGEWRKGGKGKVAEQTKCE